MRGTRPRFWDQPPGLVAHALRPIAFLYGRIAAHRLEHAPRVPVAQPVLCVGNPTVGGSGKTPTAIALAGAARAMGLRPGFLSRGHGGNGRGARLVGAGNMAAEVGDEPLLLAHHAPTAVSPDRLAGGQLLQEAGCDFIIMDDGFQSARIAIDCGLLVVDRASGLGNGLALPAGPLRAPVDQQLAHAQAVLAMGEGEAAEPFLAETRRCGLPVFSARLAARNPADVQGRSLLAFAGIGRPDKFFRSLEEASARVEARRTFGDHHAFSRAELEKLAADAERRGLALATTAKDFVRFKDVAPPGFAPIVLEVEAEFAEEDAPRRLIEIALQNRSLRP